MKITVHLRSAQNEKVMAESDEVLIRRFVAGEYAAFDEIIRRYQARAFDTAYRFLGHRTEAEDVVQEVFLKIYKFARTYSGQGKFSSWLHRIVVNLCLNRVRKKHPALHDSLETICSKLPNPGDQALQTERSEVIRQAIDALPPRQRIAVILHRFEGLPYRKIADAMDCPLSSVESLMHRAYLRLRERLAVYFEKR